MIIFTGAAAVAAGTSWLVLVVVSVVVIVCRVLVPITLLVVGETVN